MADPGHLLPPLTPGVRWRGIRQRGLLPAQLPQNDSARRAGAGRPDLRSASDRTWSERLCGAIARRGAALWRQVRQDRFPLAAEQAMEWLRGQGHRGGLAPASHAASCPGVTAAALPVLARYGQRRLARDWASWLQQVQLANGALPDATLEHPSLFNTAQALTGWLAIVEEQPAVLAAAEQAARYLARRIDATGRITTTDDAANSWDRWSSLPPAILALPALRQAATAWGDVQLKQAAERGWRHCQRRLALPLSTIDQGQQLERLWLADALLAMEQTAAARDLLRVLAATQRANGSLPAEAGHRWWSTAATAHAARLWFQLDEHDRATRALECVLRQQRADGAFLGSHGGGANYYPRQAAHWTSIHVLAAIRLGVQTSFALHPEETPREISAADGRWQAVRQWRAGLGAAPSLADVGCGAGRYLSRLQQQFQHQQLVGIDPVANCLTSLPPGIEPRTGHLPRLPAANGEFDAAMAIEALEHALLPRQAVDELCRIVRPGGQVLIIDKCRDFQDLSLCHPWERWFSQDEVYGWLSRHCGGVTVQPLQVEHARRGLFLCWTGVRRGTPVSC